MVMSPVDVLNPDFTVWEISLLQTGGSSSVVVITSEAFKSLSAQYERVLIKIFGATFCR